MSKINYCDCVNIFNNSVIESVAETLSAVGEAHRVSVAINY